MKFNKPESVVEIKPENKIENKPEKKKGSGMKVFIALLLSVITVGAAAYIYINYLSIDKSNPEDYFAVFLDNNQVYFGKMVSKSRNEVVLKNVYYLQAGGTDAKAAVQTDTFTLIKLGQELHGPTEEMMINVSHVVFYEKLREDSKVVESIKSQQ